MRMAMIMNSLLPLQKCLLVLCLSAGDAAAGDERWRTQDGLHNAVAEDSPRTWLIGRPETKMIQPRPCTTQLTAAALEVRQECPLLQRAEYFLAAM